MKKKVTVILIIVFSLLSLLSVPVLFLTGGFLVPTQYENVFSHALVDKYNRLASLKDERKIVLIGGSSVPFGVRSSLIEEQLERYEVVDFGLYASIGTKVMMDLALPYISKNDIVILSPEQNEETLALNFDGEEFLKAVDGSFSILTKLKEKERKQVIGDFVSFSMAKLNYALSNTVIDPEGIYNKKSFDTYGDISSDLCGSNILPLDYDPSQRISFEKDVIDSEFIDYMNTYYEEINKKGASLYYSFSPMNSLAVTDSSLIDSYYDYLNEQIKFPILGNVHNAVMDSGWFYDTNFHLNNSGAIVYTKQLIQSIKLTLGDDSPTDIELPDMPQKEEEEETDGDNSCLDCFTYEESEDSVSILSLSEKGKQQTSLIVPFTYNNKKIVSYHQETFTNNTVLEEVTFQSNISSLLDYSVEGSLNLKSLVLTQSKPSLVKVGYHLLGDRNDIKIYVPDESLTSYKLDYNWSSYDDYLYKVSEK